LENINIQTEDILLIVWFFLIGGAIGSFLNVVVYRLPKGMSLIEPSSHCPACKHPVRWFDNIPIISWLVLGGRCRDCLSPISLRYPLVETITACMFALLTAAEFTFKGINLPLRIIHEADNFVVIARSNSEMYGILLYHSLLLCTLLAAALIELDKNRVPWKLFVPALIIGILAPLAWPYLRPVPAWHGISDPMSRAADCLAGLGAGGLLGYMAWRWQGIRTGGGLGWGLLCIGVFLGWQAACVLSVVLSLLVFILVIVHKRRNNAQTWPLTIWLYTFAFGWILTWSSLVRLANLL
jgi:leader peptidase (prepilin peptidase) / N-methyltransferase